MKKTLWPPQFFTHQKTASSNKRTAKRISVTNTAFNCRGTLKFFVIQWKTFNVTSKKLQRSGKNRKSRPIRYFFYLWWTDPFHSYKDARECSTEQKSGAEEKRAKINWFLIVAIAAPHISWPRISIKMPTQWLIDIVALAGKWRYNVSPYFVFVAGWHSGRRLIIWLVFPLWFGVIWRWFDG